MTVSTYYETLPLHPQPELLESFTSYLIRLAEENHYLRPRAFLQLFWDKSRLSDRPADYSPSSFGRLPRAAACVELDLLKTTFYHLGKKIYRSVGNRPLGHFLKGSLSQSLRYCPACLDKHHYYSLAWRFLCLPGCVEHGCLLLDRCTHCGQVLPLFATPLKIGICSSCQGNLRTCLTKPLTPNEWLATRTRYKDLSFLLTPQGWENSCDVRAALGRQFAHLRQKKQLSQRDVDNQLGHSWNKTYLIENSALQGEGHLRRSHLDFQYYLAYAEFLEVSLFELFTSALARNAADAGSGINEQSFQVQRSLYREQEDREKQRSARAVLHEEKLLRQMKQAIDIVKAQGKPVTQHTVEEILHLTVRYLVSRYPSIKTLWQQVWAERAEQQMTRRKGREELLLRQMQEIIDRLKMRGEPITASAISSLMGMTAPGLKYYQRLNLLLISVTRQTVPVKQGR